MHIYILQLRNSNFKQKRKTHLHIAKLKNELFLRLKNNIFIAL